MALRRILIPEAKRAQHLPIGEVQRGRNDTADCASRWLNNALEIEFNYLYRTDKLSPKNKQWLRYNGYLFEICGMAYVEFSDAWLPSTPAQHATATA